MGFIFYIIIAILVAIGATYFLHRFDGDNLDDDDAIPMAVGFCLVGLIWPLAIPVTLVGFLAYLARAKGLKAYKKSKEKKP